MVPLWLCYGHVMTAALAALSARGEAVLQLPCQPGENKCVSHFLWLLHSSSILLAHILLTPDSENSVDNETIGIVSRISDTIGKTVHSIRNNEVIVLRTGQLYNANVSAFNIVLVVSQAIFFLILFFCFAAVASQSHSITSDSL